MFEAALEHYSSLDSLFELVDLVFEPFDFDSLTLHYFQYYQSIGLIGLKNQSLFISYLLMEILSYFEVINLMELLEELQSDQIMHSLLIFSVMEVLELQSISLVRYHQTY